MQISIERIIEACTMHEEPVMLFDLFFSDIVGDKALSDMNFSPTMSDLEKITDRIVSFFGGIKDDETDIRILFAETDDERNKALIAMTKERLDKEVAAYRILNRILFLCGADWTVRLNGRSNK